MTDAAQFGINPINDVIIGPIIGLFRIKFAIVSSPTKYTSKFIINVIVDSKEDVMFLSNMPLYNYISLDLFEFYPTTKSYHAALATYFVSLLFVSKLC